jgi:hypothetical protein
MGVLSCAQQGMGHLRHKSRVCVRERAWVFHPSRTRYDDVGTRRLGSVLPSEDAGGMKEGVLHLCDDSWMAGLRGGGSG